MIVESEDFTISAVYISKLRSIIRGRCSNNGHYEMADSRLFPAVAYGKRTNRIPHIDLRDEHTHQRLWFDA